MLVDYKEVKEDYARLNKKIADLKEQIEKLEKVFGHYHVNSGEGGDDSCKKCGFDLRNPIHTRFIN